MGNNDPKTQTNNKEVRHDLNNLAYLLKTLVDILAKIPNLPVHAEKILNGAIKSTEEIIKKLNGNSQCTKDKATTNTNNNHEAQS